MLVGEIAKRTGLSKDGVRHYEQLGLISSTPLEAGSKVYRDYDPSVLDTIEQIKGAQHFLRLPLKEIGPLLKALADSPPTKEQTIEYLKARVVIIREQMASLREVEDFLSRKIERYSKEVRAAQPQPKKARGERVNKSVEKVQVGS
jgi:MerR family copper efflux transcriptional regulator